MLLRVGHSPDSDDAFMFYALSKGYVTVPGCRVEHVLEDIESLNRRAQAGELEVTALSAATYPRVADRYRLLPVGWSMGENYGPMVVARQPLAGLGDLAGRRVGVPGLGTTAYLTLRLFAAGFEPVVLPFDMLPEAAAAGRVDAALLIHEGQLTYRDLGLHLVADLGQVWAEKTGGLPLPLGANAVRRDLGEEMATAFARALLASVQWALEHEAEAADHARAFARGLDAGRTRAFVRMYVNRRTLDLGEEGRRAVAELYRRAVAAGLLERVPPLEWVTV